ncbi:MAG: UDP-3-O-(3-hydroxymyristoyl)glucosamine N-acyltransferase [Parvibaculales bacterium]
MPSTRFYDRKGPFFLKDLAEIGQAKLQNPATGDRKIEDVAPLGAASNLHIGFLNSPEYVDSLAKSKAGACILASQYVEKAPESMALLVSEQPYHCYGRIAAHFYPDAFPDSSVCTEPCPDSATIGKNVKIGAGAVLGENVEIGDNTHIGANVVLGQGVIIGKNSIIGAGSVITHSIIGNNVRIYSSVSIGQDGFGYGVDFKNPHLPIPQLGCVVIEDDVDIGAQCAIDRGTLLDTKIGKGSKLDNLIHLAHNVQVGSHCLITAQAGVAGSAKIGNFFSCGGQIAINGHIEIGDGVQAMGRSCIIHDIADGEKLGGFPARPVALWRREVAAIARLAKKQKKT